MRKWYELDAHNVALFEAYKSSLRRWENCDALSRYLAANKKRREAALLDSFLRH